MKLRSSISIAILCTALLQGCYREEVQLLEVHVPQMNSDSCGKIITDRLLQVEGVQSAEVDAAAKTVTVEYLSTTIATKNIEFVIAGVGFDANERKAAPQARAALPEGCR